MTTALDEISSTQRFKEVTINENFEAVSAAGVYGVHRSTTEGLTWGYYGGRWGGTLVSDGTFTLTNAADNYMVVLRSNGTPSMSTSATNWNNVILYARVYKVTVAGGVVTATEDHRAGPYGVYAPAAAVSLRGLTFTSDTDSTADSDPGAGLFKWNNATQASATVLYFDNQTADGVSLTTFWASLPPAGFIFMQQEDDQTRWQLWKWTITPVDGTGYRKFTVTLQANSTSAIADAKSVLVDFKAPAASYQPLDSDLTAIAALTTATYGRSLLEAATAAALRVLAGLDTLTQPLMNYGGLNFNGSTTYLDTNALTGIADGKVGTIVFVVRFNGAAAATERLIYLTGGRFIVSRTSTGNIQVVGLNTGLTQILSRTTTDTPCAAAGTYVIALSWNLASAASYRIYVNNVASAVNAGTYTDDTIDYTSTEWAVGATTAGAEFFGGDMYAVWFDPTAWQELDTVSVRRKFSDANSVPQYLGRNGELPTGTAPILFLGYDSAAQWPVNRGSAQSTSFTQNGAIAAASTTLYGQWAPAASHGVIKTVTADYTVLSTDRQIISNRGATNTLTLPAAGTCKNRELYVRNIGGAFTVVSASSNVVPIAGGAAATGILAATDGAWAYLVSDGTSWQIMGGVATA